MGIRFVKFWEMSYPKTHNDLAAGNGPTILNGGCFFSVWAPGLETMTLHLPGKAAADGQFIPMHKNEMGCFEVMADGVHGGDQYYYSPEPGKYYPDPCSSFQPDGVHGPSEVVDHSRYNWQDSAWKGKPLASLIFYEIHFGTFTPEGTFEAIIPRLADLADMGIDALELMPVAQCPGERNWGYDGVFLYAVQHSYGGPKGLKRLVDACHRLGIAVFLDVVYNHLGTEGNCLGCFGPYLSEVYHTPWGKNLNFDGAWSDGVKEYIIGNALYWAEHYHLDGLRLDAVHEIFDRNAVNLWDLMHAAITEWTLHSGRAFHLIAESDLNSPRIVRPPDDGGQGFDAQWLDDFHHSLYPLLDPEGRRHYTDYGRLEQLAKAYTEGFVFSGQYVSFRHRRHGASSAGIPGDRFVVINQNHDLPGNRPDGARLSALVDFDKLKLAAAAVLLSPYLPMLFMGEEYAEDAPFYFFSDYGDADVAAALNKSRQEQFAGFGWTENAPDPQDESTFLSSKLQWGLREQGRHFEMLQWHKQLIALRKSHPLLADLSKKNIRADLLGRSGLAVCRNAQDGWTWLLVLFNFSAGGLDAVVPYHVSGWARLLASSDLPETIAADGKVFLPPWSASVYERLPLLRT
jgi:maltooligosyltrehalose trehalohydrolase